VKTQTQTQFQIQLQVQVRLDSVQKLELLNFKRPKEKPGSESPPLPVEQEKVLAL
jgi:hypothetical protein